MTARTVTVSTASRLENEGHKVWQLNGSNHSLYVFALKHGYLAPEGEEPKYLVFGHYTSHLSAFRGFNTLWGVKRYITGSLTDEPDMLTSVSDPDSGRKYRYVYVFRLDRWEEEYRCPHCQRLQDRPEECRCYVRCFHYGCRERILRDDTTGYDPVHDAYLCAAHVRHCVECSNPIATGYGLRNDHCRECVKACEWCGSYWHTEDSCDIEESDYDEFDNMNPILKFIGCGCLRNKQDPACDGFHLGIELETNRYETLEKDMLHDWANTQFGHRMTATLKEDGSVRGFELVVSPMTEQVFYSTDWNRLYLLGEDDFEAHRNAGLHVHIDKRAFLNPNGKMRYSWILALIKLLDSDYGWGVAGRRSCEYSRSYKDTASRSPINAVRQKIREDAPGYSRSRDRDRSYLTRYMSVNLCALDSHNTIEVRMFASPGTPEELKERVSLVTDAYRYIQSLHAKGESVVIGTANLEKFKEFRQLRAAERAQA